jgi:plastocyanin
MVTKHILLMLPISLALTIHLVLTETFAQQGSMATLQNIDATYAVSIVPGAAQKENIHHYYPPQIAVPTGTTVGWFNNDFGQPHTVTSGQPGATDKGSVFNSGIMPATANSFFQFTFSQPGEFLYHCIIHPWRVASVYVSDAYFRGEGFKIDIGSGAVWDISTHPRVLLDINPQTIPLDKTTPITYNITINNGANNEKMFSHLFTTAGNSLPLELISGMGNETRSYGPDCSSTGAYHVQSDFKQGSSYPIIVEIISVDSKPVENPIKVLFDLKTSS